MNHSNVDFASRRIGFFTVTFLCCLIAAESTLGQTKMPKPAETVINASNACGFDFYLKMSAEPSATGKNLFFSPYSIFTALSMLSEGAGGETSIQIADAMHLKRDLVASEKASLHEGVSSLRKAFAESTADQGLQLYSANGLWIDQSFSVNPVFQQTLNRIYGAQNAGMVNFKGDPRAARELINTWGDQQTHGKIKEMLSSDLAPDTEMVLANTVYFKATWMQQFGPQLTAEKTFHVDRDPDHDVRVPMMSQWTEASNPYMENDDFQMTMLEYGSWKHEGNGMSRTIPAYMLIVLPKRIDGLDDVAKSITWEKLDRLITGFDKTFLHIELPRFRMNSNIDLNRTLNQMGVSDAFIPNKANLSGIGTAKGGEPLYLTQATHRAVVDVNEEGTEAAATTAMIAAGLGRRPRLADFRADHPFLFYIVHRQTKAILFMGRVMNPASS